MPALLETLGFEAAIPYWKERAAGGKEKETRDALFAFLDGKSKTLDGLAVDEKAAKGIVREWKLQDDDQRKLMRDVLPRFELKPDQIRQVLAPTRAANGIHAALDAIADNPYLLSEEYTGNGPDDVITFSRIDHGVFPSPSLGGDPGERRGHQGLAQAPTSPIRTPPRFFRWWAAILTAAVWYAKSRSAKSSGIRKSVSPARASRDRWNAILRYT